MTNQVNSRPMRVPYIKGTAIHAGDQIWLSAGKVCVVGSRKDRDTYEIIDSNGRVQTIDVDEIAYVSPSRCTGRTTKSPVDRAPKDTLSHPYFILNQAAQAIENRAKERDVRSERSMRRAVNTFNALCDTDLTEEQGWKFMVVLKLARSAVVYNEDDYIDLAGYAALAGECAGQKDRMAKQSGEDRGNADKM